MKAGADKMPQMTGNSDKEAAAALAATKVSVGAFYYNKSLKTTFIKVADNKSDITIEVVF